MDLFIRRAVRVAKFGERNAAISANLADAFANANGFGDLTSGLVTGNDETKVAKNAYLAGIGDAAPLTTLEAIRETGKYGPAIKGRPKSAVENKMGPKDPKYLAILQKRDELQNAVLAAVYVNGLDAVLYPHQKRLVAEVGGEQTEHNGTLSNSSGFPAITFPGGFSAASDAAPIGLELFARPFSEGRLIGYVYAFEAGAGLCQAPQSTPAL